jgi:hypothetical protein
MHGRDISNERNTIQILNTASSTFHWKQMPVTLAAAWSHRELTAIVTVKAMMLMIMDKSCLEQQKCDGLSFQNRVAFRFSSSGGVYNYANYCGVVVNLFSIIYHPNFLSLYQDSESFRSLMTTQCSPGIVLLLVLMCEQADSRSFCQRQTNNSLRDRRHFV